MIETVYARLAASAARWPDRPLFCVLPETANAYGIRAGELSFAMALDKVDALADAYAAAGFRAGHRLLLLLENRPGYFLHWIALNRLGASAVPVNPDLRAAELAYMIGHCEPAGAVVIPERAQDLRRTATYDLPVFGPDALPLPPAQAPNAADGEAAMLYTSGTTGNPKGCVLGNAYFTMSGDWYKNAGGLCALNENGERMLTPLPVFHMNAMACSFMAMLTVGGCLIALDRFHPGTWWASVRNSRATCLHYLGVIPSILMNAPADAADKEHSVRFGFGAGVDPEMHGPFEDRFGFPLIEGWAMTETSAANAITNNMEPRPVGASCLGHPPSDVEIRVVDDAGADVLADEPGELLVRRAGDNPRLAFFDHYYKNPDATAEAWDGGWFHTGDLVRRDAEGRVFFVDRKKNIIRRSGENIAAAEVESVLMQHPEIRAAAVAPVPDDLRGEEVFALIVPERPSDALVEQIMRFALNRMAYYKAPGHIAFVEALPLTGTQKIQRGALRRLVRELLGGASTHHTAHLKKRQVA